MLQAKNVLILHVGALGDCALTLAWLRTWLSFASATKLTMAARSPLAQWAKRRGLVFDAGSAESFVTPLYVANERHVDRTSSQRLRGFDFVVSFLGGPGELVSQRLADSCDARCLCVDPKPTAQTLEQGRHITEQWARDLGAEPLVGFQSYGRLTTPVDQKRLAERVGSRRGQIILVHPGSGGLPKCCPLDALELLVKALRVDGIFAVWMIGPDEFERFGPAYVERLRASAPVLYDEDVEAAADWTCGADAFVGNDAGMTHVAALAGVPTIALFGPTDPRVWRPLGNCCEVKPFPCKEGLKRWLTDLQYSLISNFQA